MNMSTANQKTAFLYGDDDDGICIKYSDSNDITCYRQSAEELFFEHIPELFKDVNAVLVLIFSYQPIGYDSNMDFCKAVKEKSDSLKLRNYFAAAVLTAFSNLLVTTNTTANIHETVVYVMANFDDVTIYEFEYTVAGYKQIKCEKAPIDAKENPKIIREKIIASSNPKKIFLIRNCEDCPLLKFLRTALKSKKLMVFDQGLHPSDYNINELTKWLLEKSYVKYYFLPTSIRDYFLWMVGDGGEDPVSIIHLNIFKDLLPFEKTHFFTKKTAPMLQYGYHEKGREKVITTIQMEEKCHRNMITFTVNAENFLDVKHEAITYSKLATLPKMLDEKFGQDIPVIGFLGDLSVICVPDENGYKFLDAWNGLYGRDMSISFDQEKPRFCEDSIWISTNGRSKFVVSNLLLIMAMPLKHVKQVESLHEGPVYTITTDENNQVLLEFDSFDGTKKAASPAFLTAMIIKEQLKAIKKECGEKPVEIGFAILGDYKVDARKRVEEGLKEACKLLSEHRKLDCVFVDV